MMRPRRGVLLAAGVMLVLSTAVAACGADDGDDEGPERFEGAAASAVAAYFAQEVDGGLIAEGTDVLRVGIAESRMFPLTVDGAQRDAGVEARYCMEYQYTTRDGVQRFTRVYSATLADEAWTVKLLAADGTCEGVA